MPPGFCPVQVFPLHIGHFMSNMFNNLSLFEMGRQTSVSQWSSVWRGQFQSLNLDTLLVVDCSETGISMKKCSTLLRTPGRGGLAG